MLFCIEYFIGSTWIVAKEQMFDSLEDLRKFVIKLSNAKASVLIQFPEHRTLENYDGYLQVVIGDVNVSELTF